MAPCFQEWSAYALRKASSRNNDAELGKVIIETANQSGAARLLVKMIELRSREAVEEAQQTLEHFGIDGEPDSTPSRRPPLRDGGPRRCSFPARRSSDSLGGFFRHQD